MNKCFECGGINKPTKKTICDKCLKDLGKPINIYFLMIGVILGVTLLYSYYEIQMISIMVGILIGELFRRIIKKIGKKK